MDKNEKDIKSEVSALQFVDQGIYQSALQYAHWNAERDAFGRFRISSPYTLFDSYHRYRDNGKFDTSLTGTGSTAVHRTNESAIHMTVGTGASAEVIRESKKVFAYQPGKSLLIMSSFVFETPKNNLRQRVGFFGTYNGVYLEQDGLELNFVIRSYTSGSIDERRIPRSQWNGHKFDGTDFYQRNLDVTKGNILWADLEWLGVGDVRVGFTIDGTNVTAHTFHNDNIYSTTYMTTATLPLRFEITNTAATGSSSTMKQICSTVISEGGFDPKSNLFVKSTPIVTANMVSLGSAGTRVPIISLRLKSTNLDAVIAPQAFDLIMTTNDLVFLELVLNGQFAGTPVWTSYSDNSFAETAIGGTTMSGGTVVDGNFIYQKGSKSLELHELFNYQLGRSLNGVSDVITIVGTSNGTSTKVAGAIGWYEL
jgi:hypothetical protein